jgi:hypothetical protein
VLNRDEHTAAASIAGPLAALLLLLPPPAGAQTPPRKADSVVGEVATLDISARRLVLKTDAGPSVEVRLQDGATFLRAKPGASNLAEATPVPFEEIATGDRVLARGVLAEDKASLAARQLVVMTRGDIAQKQDTERADWRRRGVLGFVTAIDAASGEITLRLGRMAGGGTVVVATADRKPVFRRYASDSVKFADAKPSALGDVQAGDQLRALGDRTPDGARLVAEQIVFGTFRTVLGTITAVDPAKGEVTLRDEDTRRPLAVAVGPDARVRRLPPEIAARLSRWSDATGGSEGAGGSERAARGTGGWSRGPGAGGGPEDLLERLARTTVADLKTGDRILVSSTKGADPAHVNAIALVSGLEALQGEARPGRAARGADIGFPSDLMDLGLSVQ